MKTPTFSKAKLLNFLVNPVSAKETTSALFSSIHLSLPLKIMCLLEIEMPRFCDFKHPHRPVTLFCYGSDPLLLHWEGLLRIGNTMSRNLFSLIRYLVTLAASLLYRDGEDGLSIYTLEALHIKGCRCCVAERIRPRFDTTGKKLSFWPVATLAGISLSKTFTDLMQRGSQPA